MNDFHRALICEVIGGIFYFEEREATYQSSFAVIGQSERCIDKIRNLVKLVASASD